MTGQGETGLPGSAPASPAAERFGSLDAIRGVAVMGILVANLPAFALPEAAYFSPRAWGGATPADIAVWFATFVLVEGKLRALFSFLFGASMLLVIERAELAGRSGAAIHFCRMAVLFAIGCVHLYLLWWGDILAHYALVGSLAFLFVGLSVRRLVAVALALAAIQTLLNASILPTLLASAARDTPDAVATWNSFATSFGVPPRADLLAEIAAFRGSWVDGVAWRWVHAVSPVGYLPILTAETLAAMLLGMAGYRSGFLTGAWPRTRYRRWAVLCLGTALPAYAALGLLTASHGFDQRWVFFASIVAAQPLRLVGMAGYAALVMLLLRPGGWLTSRLAATGRAAFTNYLGTSLVMEAIFAGWGLGQFAGWSRASLYLLVPVMWLLMLVWSPWWLARFLYGPLEWGWRSLSRLAWQPMRRKGPAPADAA